MSACASISPVCAHRWLRWLFIGLLLSGCETLTGPSPEQGAVAADCPTCEPEPCPPPKVIEKLVFKTVEIPQAPEPATAGELQLPIIGAVEWVRVEPPDLRLEARIDTGAETTSIHAEEIELVEIDGRRYVRYVLSDPESGARHPMETRLRRRVLIRQPDDVLERRYVVRLWVTLGAQRARIDVTLSDRAEMEYPLLIGRNMLTDAAVVDVSQHHTLLY